MRKFLILAAILLFGAGSVFAQNSWEVLASWTFAIDSDCDDQLTNQHGYVVALTINDVANDSVVTYNAINTPVWTATSSLFTGAQTKLQAYCNGSHEYTPSFTIIVVIRIYFIPTETEVCYTRRTMTGISCSTVSSGYEVQLQFN